LSSNSRYLVVPDAGHEIHLFQPAAAVQAIRDVTAAVIPSLKRKHRRRLKEKVGGSEGELGPKPASQ